MIVPGSDTNVTKKQTPGTPRFPTDEEIEAEERRLLLSFAFKDQDEIEKYRREMNHILSQEFLVERPPESKYRDLKYKLRSKCIKISKKKTGLNSSLKFI